MKFRNPGERREAEVSGVKVAWREPSIAALCDVQVDLSEGRSFGDAALKFVAEHLLAIDGQDLPADATERRARVSGMADHNVFLAIFEQIFSGGEKLKNS